MLDYDDDAGFGFDEFTDEFNDFDEDIEDIDDVEGVESSSEEEFDFEDFDWEEDVPDSIPGVTLNGRPVFKGDLE